MSSPPPSEPAHWLERFLEVHPDGDRGRFEAWAEAQTELAAVPELLAATRNALERWHESASLLGRDSETAELEARIRSDPGAELGSGLSCFHRSGRSGDGAEGGTVAETLRARQRIGNFTLLRFIARGGMGQVWEAEDSSLRRRVALKLVLPDRVDERSLALFAREARAGGRLSHPNLVTTLGHGTDGGLTWISQELVEGSWTVKDSLNALRAEDSVPKGYYREAAELVARIADGMQAAHDAGVIHRDLKPQNVLVSDDDQPKVTDFGLARVTDDSFLSQSGDFGGTWAYMSPEQVTAKRMGLDHRTDIFSLGVVLYELLTLRRPFEGDTTHQIATRIITEDPPLASRVRSQCPMELSVICARAMEKSPDRRYGTMAELAADLRRHLADEPILAKPTGPIVRATKWIRRHPAISSAGAIAGVALVAVSLLSVNLATQTELARQNERLATRKAEEARAAELQAEQQRSRAEQVAYNASILATGATLRERLSSGESLAEADILNVRDRLESCLPELRGWEWEHLDLVMDSSQVTLTRPDFTGWLTKVSWGPTFRRVLGAYSDEVLQLWDVESEEVRWSVEGCSTFVWSPDGARVLAVSEEGLRLLDAGTGELLGELEGSGPISFSPDGERITSGSDGHVLLVRDVQTGAALLELRGHAGPVNAACWSPDGARIASASEDGTTRTWDAKTGEALLVLEDQLADVVDVAFDPTGEYLASVSLNIRVWDAGSGEEVYTSRGVPTWESVSWDPSGTRISSGSAFFETPMVYVWDLEHEGPLRSLAGHTGPVLCVDWDPTGRRLASCSLDGTIKIWSSATSREYQTLDRCVGRSIAWDPGGKYFAVGTWSGGVQLLDASTGELLRELQGHGEAVTGVAWSPGGAHLASSAEDGTLHIWSPSSGESLLRLEVDGGWPTCLAWEPSGERIAAVCTTSRNDLEASYTLRVWSASSGAQLLESELQTWGMCVAWDPSDEYIVAEDHESGLRCYDPSTGEHTRTIGSQLPSPLSSSVSAFESPITCLAWHEDGTRIAGGNMEGRIQILDAASGDLFQVLTGHSDEITALAWNPDGTRLVSGSLDGTMRLWEPTRGENILTLQSPGKITEISFNPAGSRIATAFEEGAVRIWESRPEEAVPLWRESADMQPAREWVDALSEEHVLQELVLEAIMEDRSRSEKLREAAAHLARARGTPRAETLNSLAWPLVNPARVNRDTDVAKALRLSAAMVAAEPESERYRDTHAWALFANGLHEEALAQSRQALVLAGEAGSIRYRKYLRQLEAAIAAARDGAPEPAPTPSPAKDD